MKYIVHHIAQVVENIESKYEWYQKFGFSIAKGFEKPQPDTAQQVIVGVVQKDNTTIELLEPLSESSPVYTFLQKGGGFHHICYEVADIHKAIQYMKKTSRQITKITTSVWDKRPVVFFINKDNDIVELIGYN